MTDSNDVPGEMPTPANDPNDYQPGTDPGLDAMFAELSQAAHSGSPVEPSDALQSFVSIGRVDLSDSATGGVVHDLGTVPMGASTEPETPRRKPLLSTFTALFATATGKLVLTGSLAAASVAGAHSTGVVDVPLLPEVNEPAVVIVQDDEAADDRAEFAAQTDTTTTTVPGADDTEDSADDRMDDDVDSFDDIDSSDDDNTSSVTVTINGEEVELTDDEIDAFLDQFEADIEANTEAWEAAVAACEAAFDTIAPDAGAGFDPADIDAFMAQVDDAMQACFDAIDDAGFAGPLSGLDLDDIEDFDFDLDLDDLGEFDLDFDLDDLFDEDFPFDDHDGFPLDPEAFGDFDLEGFDFDEFDFEDFDGDFPFGELPFDPTDPNGFDQWLQDQGIDLDDLGFDLSDLEGFSADGFDFDDLGAFDDLIDQFEDDWDEFEDDWDELEDDIDS